MALLPDDQQVREVVGAFATKEAFQAAVDEVLASGADHSDLSLLGTEAAVQQKIGRRYADASEVEDDPTVPRVSYVADESVGDAEGGLVGGFLYVGALAAAGTVLASGGTLAPAIGAAALAGGAGGLFGTVLARLLGARHSRIIREHLQHSGLLLWVRVWDEDAIDRVSEILTRTGGRDVHVHRFVPTGAAATQSTDGKKAMIALFGSKGEAENARHRLISEGVAETATSLRVIKEIGEVPDSMDPELWSFSYDPFFWFLGNLKEDYAKYIKNGETALSVEIASDREAEAVESILGLFNPLRIDRMEPKRGADKVG